MSLAAALDLRSSQLCVTAAWLRSNFENPLKPHNDPVEEQISQKSPRVPAIRSLLYWVCSSNTKKLGHAIGRTLSQSVYQIVNFLQGVRGVSRQTVVPHPPRMALQASISGIPVRELSVSLFQLGSLRRHSARPARPTFAASTLILKCYVSTSSSL